ncbi:MAG: hypothetical protein HQM12_20155 [SAR324 cluster bacterium]|nr:hypothetical protein [SAR324 cluster bacterium]
MTPFHPQLVSNSLWGRVSLKDEEPGAFFEPSFEVDAFSVVSVWEKHKGPAWISRLPEIQKSTEPYAEYLRQGYRMIGATAVNAEGYYAFSQELPKKELSLSAVFEKSSLRETLTKGIKPQEIHQDFKLSNHAPVGQIALPEEAPLPGAVIPLEIRTGDADSHAVSVIPQVSAGNILPTDIHNPAPRWQLPDQPMMAHLNVLLGDGYGGYQLLEKSLDLQPATTPGVESSEISLSAQASAILVQNPENILLLGGLGTGGIPHGQIGSYHPQTMEFSLSESSLPEALAAAALVTLGDTRYLIGGYDGREPTLSMYQTSLETTTPWEPSRSLPIPLAQVCAGVVDGKIVFAGGITSLNGELRLNDRI